MRTLVLLAALFYLGSLSVNNDAPQVIYLPSGETILNTPIVLTSGQSLVGNNSTLKIADNANCSAIIVGDLAPSPITLTTNVYITGVKIDGNRKNNQFEGWGGNPDDVNANPLRVIRNNGITIRHAEQVVIENVEIFGARSGGIVIERGSEHITIINAKLYDNEFDGLAIYEAENCLIYNVDLFDNQYAGISIDLQANKNVFSNVRAYGNGHQGVFLRNSDGNQFYSPTLKNNVKHGIFIAESELGAAHNNIFLSPAFSQNGENFRVNDQSCTNNLLKNPTFDDEVLTFLKK